MPLPLIPILTALAAGGSLVPHAAGGMIVTSAAGYVAGTYLSTAAIGSLLAAGSTALGAGALYLSGVAGSVIGSAGVFGTTVGATGATGALMSAGIISSTPIWVPIAVGGAAIGGAPSARALNGRSPRGAETALGRLKTVAGSQLFIIPQKGLSTYSPGESL